MPYNKTLWINNNEPPISADNLNKIEQGIYDNSIAVETQEGLLDGHTVRSDVPSNAVFTDTTYTAGQNVQINGTTISATDTVYDDTNIKSRVSTVESLLDGHSVGKNVPADAVFTDTVYDDTALSERVSENEDDISDLEDKTTHLGAGTTYYDFAPQIELTEQLGINAEGVKVKIEAVQSGSGTPSPQNVRPITGFDVCVVERTGDNIIPSIESGSYSQSTGAKSADTRRVRTPKFFVQKGSYFFTFSTSANGKTPRMFYLLWNSDAESSNAATYNSNWINEDTQIIITADTYISIQLGYTDDTDVNIEDIQARLVDFESYKQYTINLGGTIYGGTLDVTNGVLTMDRRYVEFDGSDDENWVYDDNTKRAWIKAVTGIKGPADTRLEVMCNIGYFREGVNIPGVVFGYSTENLYYYPTEDITSVSDFKTWLASNNMQIVYELATPITIQLTPQQIQLLDGYNLIQANTGDIAVTTGDIESAIGQADALIEANIQAIREIDSFNASIFGPVENGTTASQAYAQGDYFVMGNKMAKALTNIAQGATFTLNTNYAAYTIAEILKAIEQS